MNVMGDVIFDTLRKLGLIMFWDSFQSFGRPLLVHAGTVFLFPVSNNVVCFAQNCSLYHKSNRSKLQHDIYFCMGGPLDIVELSDSSECKKAQGSKRSSA